MYVVGSIMTTPGFVFLRKSRLIKFMRDSGVKKDVSWFIENQSWNKWTFRIIIYRDDFLNFLTVF